VTRLNALLIVILMASALSLVSSQYQTRRLIGDLELAQAEERRQEIVWNQLQLDQASLSKHQLIDTAARRDLNMQPATPSRTEYITLSHDAMHAAAISEGGPQ
jgi:cell division protein FtsL